MKRIKDPNGGLTPYGRKYYREKFGNNLRPGVTRPDDKLTKTDLRRKGSWLRRHYGKKNIPPLKDERGNPTRYALQANAWGEKVPTTKKEVRELGNKGKVLLGRYREANMSRQSKLALFFKKDPKYSTQKRKQRKREQNGRFAKVLRGAESASRTARNLSLAAETPSKIARNASVTARNVSRSAREGRVDRYLSRVNEVSRIGRRWGFI